MADIGDAVGTLLKKLAGADPSRPLLTFYDQRTGERVELSGATMENWVAKTANLLVDGCGLGPGDTAAVWLPPHWQTAAVLLGCWTAGVRVAFGPADDAAAGVAFAGTEMIGAAPGRLAPAALDRFALGLAPLGRQLDVVPAGWGDYIAEVRGHGDTYQGRRATGADPAWLHPGGDSLRQRDLLAEGLALAERLGVPAGGRVLVDGDAHPAPTEWLLAPLAAGSAIVLVVGLDGQADGAAGIAATERADAVIGPPG